jgi:hypothetical protein
MRKRYLVTAVGSLCVAGLAAGGVLFIGVSGQSASTALGAQPDGTQPAWPGSDRVSDIEFSIVQSPLKQGEICVKARVGTQTPDLICGAPSDVARDGAIFGLQENDGPIRVYGLAPLGSNAAALKGGRVVGFSKAGSFFQGTMAAGSDVTVDFSWPDGSVTVGHLGQP